MHLKTKLNEFCVTGNADKSSNGSIKSKFLPKKQMEKRN